MMPLNKFETETACGGAPYAKGAAPVNGSDGGASRGSHPAGSPVGLGGLGKKAAPRPIAVKPAFRLRRWHVLCALVVVGATVLGLCWRYLPDVYAWLSNPAAVHAYVDEHAVLSRIAIVGINTLQIILAFLPGEPIELASGYAFGFWEGTAACLVASALGSSLVYWSVRRWGWKVMGLFFTREQFERFSWLKDARKLELIMLVIFLIPGTPQGFPHVFRGPDAHALWLCTSDRHRGQDSVDRDIDHRGVRVWRGRVRHHGDLDGGRGPFGGFGSRGV